jgi:hypothetical protein
VSSAKQDTTRPKRIPGTIPAMSNETIPQPHRRSPPRPKGFRIGAVVVVALAAGVVLWLSLRDTGSSSTSNKTPSGASAVSVRQLKNLAVSLGHPIFWLGPKKGSAYELSRTSSGTIFLRYLPRGVAVGSADPYLTVATYPFPGAFTAIQAVAGQSGSTRLKLAHRGLAVISTGYPESAHVAYPGLDYQVEVFDPTPGNATAMVAAGQLRAIGKLAGSAGTAPKPTAASVAALKSLGHSLGHPIYWVGPQKGVIYELTRSAGGQVYIRYLPQGVKVGTAAPYLTVATYPFPGAFGATQALATQTGNHSIKLPHGGLAVVNTGDPESIHLAFPGSDYQVEVYDPSPSHAQGLVTSGRVAAVG